MKKTIVKIKKENNYTSIDNKILQNQKLSWKAKGLLCYLMSLPDDWQIYLSEIEQHSRDGRDSTRKAMEELIENNYITREKNRTSEGKFAGYVYTVRETPLTKKSVTEKPKTEKPKTEKPKTEKPKTEKPKLLITNNTNNLNIQNTDINKESIAKEKKHSPKTKYLDFIFLKEDEINNLNEKYGNEITKQYIEQLNNYIGSTGKIYKSHYFTIINWINKDVREGRLKIKGDNKNDENGNNAEDLERGKRLLEKQRQRDEERKNLQM